jgi:mRNA interferase HigB
MHIVTRRHLREAIQRYPDAARELAAWITIVEGVRWQSFLEVRRTFPDADSVQGYVVFNIRGNRYRLITVAHYARQDTQGHIYIRSLLTHKQYDDPANWDRRFGTV